MATLSVYGRPLAAPFSFLGGHLSVFYTDDNDDTYEHDDDNDTHDNDENDESKDDGRTTAGRNRYTNNYSFPRVFLAKLKELEMDNPPPRSASENRTSTAGNSAAGRSEAGGGGNDPNVDAPKSVEECLRQNDSILRMMLTAAGFDEPTPHIDFILDTADF